jgi:hypothetical protein
VARKIRANKFKHIKTIDEFIIPNVQRYPYFFHYLLALLPFNTRIKFEKISGAFFDTLYLMIFYFFALYLQNKYDFSDFKYFPETVCTLFAVSPALLRSGDGPRAFNCTPRVFALLLYIGHLLMFFIYVDQNNIYAAILSIIIGGFACITAIFSLQTMLFFAPFFIFGFSYSYLLFFLSAYAFSILVSKGWSIEITKGIIKHLSYYYTVQKALLSWMNVGYKKYFVDLKNQIIWFLKSRDVKPLIKWYVSVNLWPHLLITIFPFVLFSILIYFRLFNSSELPVTDKFFFIYTFAGFVCFLITKHHPFQFLGSGERYLEYVFLPATFLFVKYAYINDVMWMVYVFLGYSVILLPYLLYIYVFNNRPWNDLQKELAIVFKHTKDNFNGIFAPLQSLDAKVINFYSDHRLLVYPTLRDNTLFPNKEYETIWGEKGKGFISGNIKEIFEKYNCKYLFVKKADLPTYKSRHAENASLLETNFREVYSTENFAVLEFVS